ncbi:MAG: hypothetical protein OHK0013_11900 [Sandaracinaceae bacterium]
MTDLSFHDSDLVSNPTPRVPVCLCLDVSGSMLGAPIEELARGVQLFFDAVRADEVARSSVEVSVVTFGPTRLALDFAPIEKQTVPPLVAAGDTPMGNAVLLALDTLERRKTEYRAAGVDYFQPWLVLMTDGQPTTRSTRLQPAPLRSRAAASSPCSRSGSARAPTSRRCSGSPRIALPFASRACASRTSSSGSAAASPASRSPCPDRRSRCRLRPAGRRCERG